MKKGAYETDKNRTTTIVKGIPLVVLPHQLFEIKHLKPIIKKHECNKVIMWEHPQYFKTYNYNQKRLLMHFGSMKYYKNYLKKKNINVEYVKLEKSKKIETIINSSVYLIFDPVDKIKIPKGSIMLETPNFLLSREIYQRYRMKTDKFFFNYFYMWSKDQINLLKGVKSKDKDNRKGMPSSGLVVPPLPPNTSDKKYIEFGKNRVVEAKLNKNYGTTDDFQFPLTHKTAKKWLKYFIQKKFDKFGEYQDAIDKHNSYLFHSLLSTSINIGLLDPREVADEVMKYKGKVPINSLEGFIRQLFWREYQRYCYIYYPDFSKENYFSNKKKLTNAWYNGSTGVTPVDQCIRNAFKNGYLHHIERLMVIGNFMNLSGISPKEGFRWFMEFSCDSYEWVMHQNVYDMVFFVTGGVTMRRPYISSSNYILKMSNYKKGECLKSLLEESVVSKKEEKSRVNDCPWNEKWDTLYHSFLKMNRKKLLKFRYYFRSL